MKQAHLRKSFGGWWEKLKSLKIGQGRGSDRRKTANAVHSWLPARCFGENPDQFRITLLGTAPGNTSNHHRRLDGKRAAVLTHTPSAAPPFSQKNNSQPNLILKPLNGDIFSVNGENTHTKTRSPTHTHPIPFTPLTYIKKIIIKG